MTTATYYPTVYKTHIHNSNIWDFLTVRKVHIVNIVWLLQKTNRNINFIINKCWKHMCTWLLMKGLNKEISRSLLCDVWLWKWEARNQRVSGGTGKWWRNLVRRKYWILWYVIRAQQLNDYGITDSTENI